MDSRLLSLLETEPDSVDVNELAGILGEGVSKADAKLTLNALLAGHRVEMIKVGEAVHAKAAEPAGWLTNEESLLNSLVIEAGNRGIWIRYLRDRSGLSQEQIRKALKSLEQKKQIKAVKSNDATKKCSYVPYDADEEASFTGGGTLKRQLNEELLMMLLRNVLLGAAPELTSRSSS